MKNFANMMLKTVQQNRRSRMSLIAVIILIIFGNTAFSQKVGFISSEAIRKNFIESKQAEQRIQSIVEEWKRELDALQKEIETLEYEIKKNRLVWSDEERLAKEKELQEKKDKKLGSARSRFEANGEYDVTVQQIMRPVEGKIFAAVQEVASDEGFDMIIDQSVQPLPYVNYKYDMTVKVLRKLGVNTDELEKELEAKIENDPRNKQKESFTPRRKSRSRGSQDSREIEREEDEKNVEPEDSVKTSPARPPMRPPR